MRNFYRIVMCLGLLIFMLGSIFVLDTEAIEEDKPWESMDLEGETITIAFANAWLAGVTQFGSRHEYSWLEPDERVQAHIDSVEEKFNVEIKHIDLPYETFEFDGIGQYILQEVIGGDPPFDIVITGRQAWPRLALEGALLPIDEYVPELFWKSVTQSEDREIHKQTMQSHMVAGNLYSIPRGVGEPSRSTGGTGILFDKNAFEEAGLTSPYELFEAGEWTYDTFKEYARELTKDTTGDGEIDQYGIRFSSPMAALRMVVTNDVEPVATEDGKRVYNLDHPQAIEVIEFMQDLWQEDLVDTGPGQSAMTFFGLGRIQYDRFQEEGEDWGWVPAPKGPSADRNVAVGRDRAHGPVLPATLENPREVLEVFWAVREAYLPYWEMDFEDLQELEWDDALLEWVHDRESLEMADYAAENTVSVIDSEIIYPSIEEGLEEIIYEGRSAASIIDEYESTVQAVLNEFYDQ